MDSGLKDQYMHAIFRFKKMGMVFHQIADVNMNELVVMRGIAGNSFSDNNTCVSEIQSNLHITKSAISQMMNSLEKKGYIEREIDKNDRRKVIVTLTKMGMDVLKKTKDSVNQLLDEIFSRFGEENTKQLISLINLLSDISEELKEEITMK